MSELRLRGQEVTVRLAQDGRILAEITAIKNLEVTFQFKKMEEGYLGERTQRHDDVFDGVSGSFTLHPEGDQALKLIDFLMQRTQRRVPAGQGVINITATYNFPNGSRPRVLIPDIKFDPIKLGTGGRDEYVAVDISFAADTAKIITT